MGISPIPPRKQPTRESFHLGTAKRAYVDGDIELEEFEAAVEHVLKGGTLTSEAKAYVELGHQRPLKERPTGGGSIPPPIMAGGGGGGGLMGICTQCSNKHVHLDTSGGAQTTPIWYPGQL